MDSFDRGTSGGYVCQSSCYFDSSKIDSMRVYVLYQEGKFDVRLKSIVAVKEKRSFQSPKIERLDMEDLNFFHEIMDTFDWEDSPSNGNGDEAGN